MIHQGLFAPAGGAETVTLGEGAILFRGHLSPADQRRLTDRCRELAAGTVGPYRPTVRGGTRMRIDMLCLGRHWNPRTYRYEPTRADHDGQPAPPIPADFVELASGVAARAGHDFVPDICLVNFYPADGRLGLHQDRDESPESLAAGVPIVSLSLGDTARFLLGGTRRKDPVQVVWLASGDALVLGGPGRLRYHGVSRIVPGTAPPEIALEGRFNLTFRRY